jgi:hypothetical protein
LQVREQIITQAARASRFNGRDHRVFDRGGGIYQRQLNFARLNAKAIDLELLVSATLCLFRAEMSFDRAAIKPAG